MSSPPRFGHHPDPRRVMMVRTSYLTSGGNSMGRRKENLGIRRWRSDEISGLCPSGSVFGLWEFVPLMGHTNLSAWTETTDNLVLRMPLQNLI